MNEYPFLAKARESGGSLIITIPMEIVDHIKIKDGQLCKLTIEIEK